MKTKLYIQGSPKDVVLFRTFCFSLNLTGTLNLTKKCTLPLVKIEKMGNTSCLQPKYYWI